MDITMATTLMFSGTPSPESSDITTPSYVDKSRKAGYCIQLTLELVVFLYLMCH